MRNQDIVNTHYLDGFQYTESQMDFFSHTEGYVKGLSAASLGTMNYEYVYTYTDHLGNIRLRYTMDRQNDELKILEEDHYYPFGLKHKGYNPENYVFNVKGEGIVEIVPVTPDNRDTYKYKFGGKEYQDEFSINMYDFGARNYDPALGRWMNIDPLAELIESESPFNYALNNPIYYRDSDGRAPKGMLDPYLIFNGKDNKLYIYDDNGTPDDKSDDILLGVFDAHNIVDSKSQGKWEDGTYNMFDKTKRRTRGSMETVNLPLFNYYVYLKLDLFNAQRLSYTRKGTKSVRVKQDSDYGAYGSGGIYRSESFTQSDGKYRQGMAVHSGRLHKSFLSRVTFGCIRTTDEAMTAIDNAILNYGPLSTITVEENLSPVTPRPEVTPIPKPDLTWPDSDPIPFHDPGIAPIPTDGGTITPPSPIFLD